MKQAPNATETSRRDVVLTAIGLTLMTTLLVGIPTVGLTRGEVADWCTGLSCPPAPAETAVGDRPRPNVDRVLIVAIPLNAFNTELEPELQTKSRR